MATKAKKPADAELEADVKKVGEEIAKTGKVRIKIPLDPLNKSDKVVPVCINGRQYRINRGETVEVPDVVAEVLEQGGYI